MSKALYIKVPYVKVPYVPYVYEICQKSNYDKVFIASSPSEVPKRRKAL